MPWDEAYNRSLKLSGPDEGFYLSLKVSPHDYKSKLTPGSTVRQIQTHLITM